MCSIIGYCDTCTDIAAFTDGFMETVSRGPDDSRIVDTGHGLLGFHRLAIMGLTPEGMQPFRLGDSYVVCNGEIYGYEKCKAKLLERAIPSAAVPIARYFCRCTRNMAWTCSECWTRSML